MSALLWEACRWEPRPDVVRHAVSRLADAREAVEAAVAHRVEGLVRRAVVAAGCGDALRPAGDELQRLGQLRRMEAATVLPHALSLATRPLLDGGMEPLLFKGPALARRYPEAGLRSMVDIDLVLPSWQRDRALAALDGAGWMVVRPAARAHHETVLAHREVPGMALELHHDLATWDQRSNRLTGNALWALRQPQECLGLPLFGLPPEEELVALAAHAGKPFHCFRRLVWSADLVVLSRRAEGGLDWDRVAWRAAGWGARTVVAVALGQAGHAGLESPAHLRSVPGPSARRTALAPLLDADWPLLALDGSVPEYRLRFALADGVARPAVLLLGSAAGQPFRRWPRTLVGGAARALWRTAKR